MKNTGLIIALGVVSGIAVAATVALSTKGGRDAAEKATGKVKEVSGKAVAKTKEVSDKVAVKTKEVSGKVLSKLRRTRAIEATCEEIPCDEACECSCDEAACEAAAEEIVCEAAEELPEIEPEA